MTDVVDAATRSRMMSGIQGKNTSPERFVRSTLHRRGFRFRLHVRNLPGTPDIVMPRYRAVVMVNGCFWHWHMCSLFRMPSTRPDFWSAKLDRNRSNDTRNTASLIADGWRVAVVWECAIRGSHALDCDALGEKLAKWLHSDAATLEISSIKSEDAE